MGGDTTSVVIQAAPSLPTIIPSGLPSVEGREAIEWLWRLDRKRQPRTN